MTQPNDDQPERWSSQFLAGAQASLPLLASALPLGMSYALTSRQAGLTDIETLLLSLTVSSASVQFSATQLFQSAHPVLELLLTALVLTLHQMLFGVALGQTLPLTSRQRLLAAALLNDGPYAVTSSATRPSFARLLGAEVSMYGVWNGATLLGILVGAQLPQLLALELDVLVPLLFLALLLPQIRSAMALGMAISAGLLAAALGTVAPTSVALLLGIGLTLGGGWLIRRTAPLQRRAR